MSNGNLKFSLVMRAVTDEFNSAVKQAKVNYEQATASVRAESKETETKMQGLSRGVEGVGKSFIGLQGILATVGLALSIKQIADAADAYKNLEARIKLVTGEGANFQSAFDGVQKVALATNSSLESTGTLFTKIAQIGKTMGISQAEALKITETINQSIQLSGASAQASDAAITQLIQSLQSGVLRGDEFNSIMEQAPRLSQALATSLGVTTGELRKMAEAGQLSSTTIIKALQDQAGTLNSEFATLPLTIGRSIENLKTQFMLFIGETDKASAVSEKAAGFIQMIADNLGELSVFVEDAKRGIAALSEKLGEVDPKTIEALKAALRDMYDILKEFGVSAVETLGDTIAALNELSNVLGSVEATTDEKVSAMTRTMQGLSIAFGFVLDGVYTLRIGYNLLISTLAETAGWFMKIQAFYALDDAERDRANKKAEEYFLDAQARIEKTDQLAQDFQSRGMARLRQAAGDESEINIQKLADAEKTLADIAAAEKESADKHATYQERKKVANDAYLAAINSGNQGLIESTKSTLDEIEGEEKKHADSKAASDKKEIKAQQDKAQALIDANHGVLTGIIQSDFAAQGFILTLDKGGKAVVQDFRNMGASSAEMGHVASEAAKTAATALGIDLDVALNKVSRGFTEGKGNVGVFAKGLSDLGVTGVQAATLVYEAWEKWLNTAKSPAEINEAKAKLQEFEKQGVFSTKQVELGMQAIQRATQKLPNDLDVVGAAFERLGIKTKEQLKLAAQSALADLNTVAASGKATAEAMQQAVERTLQAAIASGDQVVIEAANAKAAQYGLQVQADSTGKSIVSAMDDASSATDRAYISTQRLADGYKDVGQQAEEAAAKAKKAQDAAFENHPTDLKNALNGLNLQHYSQDAVIQKLTSAGFDLAEATRRAKEIMNTDLQRRQEYARTAGFGNLDINKITNAAGIDALVAQAVKYKSSSDSSGSNFSDPYAVAPPQTSNSLPTLPASSNASGKTIAVNFNLGGKQVSAQINSNDESSFLAMLEQAKGLS